MTESGSVLVVVLALILAMLVVGSVFVRLMSVETMIAENLETRTRALHLAEAGVHMGIVYLEVNTNWPTYLPKAPESSPLDGGTVTYLIDTTSNPNRARIVGTGRISGSERELEVTVSR